jgi:phosphoserine aminotransferase
MSFGDNSTVFQRAGTLGAGGLRVETGEWTQGGSADISIPTQFTRVISFISESGDGSCSLTSMAEVSNGVIAATTNETTSGVVITYVAFGW